MKAATHYLIMGWAWVSAVVLVGAVGTIIAFLLIKGLPALDLQLIFGSSDPLSAVLLQKQVFDGLLPAIAGTLVLVVTAVAIALPVGLGAGIYLAEYSHGNVKRLLSLLFDILTAPKSAYRMSPFTTITIVSWTGSTPPFPNSPSPPLSGLPGRASPPFCR
jgi:phosphate transport system permease protein